MISSHTLKLLLQSTLGKHAHKQFFGHVCFVNNKLKITLTPIFNLVTQLEIFPSTSQIMTLIIRCGTYRHRPCSVILISQSYIVPQPDIHALKHFSGKFLQPTNTNYIISLIFPNYFIT